MLKPILNSLLYLSVSIKKQLRSQLYTLQVGKYYVVFEIVRYMYEFRVAYLWEFLYFAVNAKNPL